VLLLNFLVPESCSYSLDGTVPRLDAVYQPPNPVSSPHPCRKWRTPVITIAIPSLSAAATTSASRIDPPG
jgi:hypothetical protein